MDAGRVVRRERAVAQAIEVEEERYRVVEGVGVGGGDGGDHERGHGLRRRGLAEALGVRSVVCPQVGLSA